MVKNMRPLSEFQMALFNFQRNRPAVVCVVVLCLLYGGAVFADFLSPYSYDNEERGYSYCPPMGLQWFAEGTIAWPYVPGVVLTFDERHNRVYKTEPGKKYPLKFFVKGEGYKLLGFIPMDYHLFGVEAPGHIYVLGAD